jgi:Zn-dependent protease with chaperone function
MAIEVINHRISNYLNMITKVIVFVALFFTPCFIAAQELETDENSEQPSAYWNININAQGKASTIFSLSAQNNDLNAEDTRKELVTDLQEALECRLENVYFHTDRYGVNIKADCLMPIVKKALDMKVLIKPSVLQSRIEKFGSYNITLIITVPELGYNRAPSELKEISHGTNKTYSLHAEPDEKAIQDITLRFGYRKNYMIVLAAVVLIMLFVPIWLILVVRRRSLMLAEQDATAAWFGYWRVHGHITQGVWIGWLIALSIFNVDTFIEFFSSHNQPVLNAMLLFIPPGIVSFVCQYLARPLWLKVRGIAWNRQDMLIKGFWQHVATILPLAFLIIGINSLFRQTGQAMLWFAASLIATPLSAWMNGKISKTLPCALHGGELYENIFQLARRAGVKMQRIFLMPTQHLQMGNAFAMKGGSVMITDYLLERLTKKETDCVMAHEIGHVKKNHTLFLSWMGFLVIFLIINHTLPVIFHIILSMAQSTSLRILEYFDEYFLYPLSLISSVLVLYFLSRRFERSADDFAALLTNDPENMITSLVKVSKMNLMPITWGKWDERFSTHPATLRRAEHIAKNHGIPSDRLSVLLETQPNRKEGLGYTVPDDVTKTGLVFSTERKTKIALVNTYAILFTMVLTPLLIGNTIRLTGLSGYSYIMGIVLVPFLYILIASFISVRGYGTMKLELISKLERDGVSINLKQVHFAGFTPEEFPRSYNSHAIWDIGFLRVEESALFYFGDKISFRIPREKIISIEQGPSYPAWVTIPETYIRWIDGENDKVLHLHSLEGNSMFQLGRQSKLLLSRLMDWKQGKIADSQMPVNESILSLPTLTDVKGVHPKTSLTSRSILSVCILLGFLDFGLSYLFGLNKAIAWYGFGMALWCMLVSYLPVWRYKDF